MRLLAALLGAILILVTASPADAAPSGRAARLSRTVGVDIIVPTAVNLGGGFVGGTLTGRLGTVEVRDSRGPVNPNSWVATVSATAFVAGAGGPQRTIDAGRVSYWSGPVVRSTGSGTLVPGQPTSAQAVTLHVAREALRKTTGAGGNTVAWEPTIRIAIPTGVVRGGYRGEIVHSVA